MTAPPPPAPSVKKKDCAARLAALFPALFGVRTIRPLKLRIQADIQQRAPGEFSRAELSAFLHRYTGSNAYLEALVRSRSRFDLDGQPAGELSEEHLAVARAELERRRALLGARLKEQDEQRRSRAALLRDFESTTLSRANFCALKGLDEAGLDALLEQARREAAQAPMAPAGAGPRPGRPAPPGPRDARPAGGRGRGPARSSGPGQEGPGPGGGQGPGQGQRRAQSQIQGQDQSPDRRQGPRPPRGR